jgi:hypothetical protein
MKAIFHPEAYDEMLESARYFEDKTPRLGQRNSQVDSKNMRFPESGSIGLWAICHPRNICRALRISVVLKQ